MRSYSFQFSYRVVDQFTKCHPRGWAIFRRIFPDFKIDDVVAVFQRNQLKWNVFKKIIKLQSRVGYTNFCENHYTYVKYFNDYEKKLYQIDPKRRIYYLTKEMLP